jgi:hypothetical protein
MQRQTIKPVVIKFKKLGRERLRGYYAVDGDGDTKGPLIVLDPRLEGEELLDTLIHELLHHSLPDLDEAPVERTATFLARSLWNLSGFSEIKRGRKKLKAKC